MNVKGILACYFFIPILMMPQVLKAQNNGYLYGKVTTVDDKQYSGAIRWGKEEVFWTDMFNASKDENENLRYLSRSEKDQLEEQKDRENNHGRYGSKLVKWVNENWSSNIDGRNEHVHQFACQFGEIQKIENTSRSKAYVTLRNGDVYKVNGNGYNDLGSSIKILDEEIGEIRVSWNKIDQVEFMQAPKSFEESFGEPLYGTVETDNGTFEGFVQWDHDERLDSDKLDGETSDGDLSIAFSKIQSIERSGNRSDIVLNSGREMTLRGSNDVNSENRGVIVSNEQYGRVDIPWDEFRKVNFKKQKNNLKAFQDFNRLKPLSGTVKLSNGESVNGTIIYDLDEEMNIEVLQGKDNDLEYVIPFSKVKSITPKNYDYSKIELADGTELTLGESADVSDKNSGLLVFKGSDDPVYILWEDVASVTFDK